MAYLEYFSVKNVSLASNLFRLFCLILFFYELGWAYKVGLRISTVRQIIVNFGTGIGVMIIGGLGVHYVYYPYLWQPLGHASPLFGFWRNSFIAFFVTLLAMDFVYYWAHRLSHQIPLLWFLHSPHHSDEHVNISTGHRVSFTCFTVWFFTPAAYLGVPTPVFWAAMNISALYPVWLHAQFVPRIPILDTFLMMPSTHRAHHGMNQIYKNKNFGLFFTVFDRLFGSYQPETEKPIYFDPKLSTDNFIGLQLVGIKQYLSHRRARREKRRAEAA